MKYQWVYNLTVDNIVEFEPLSFPSIKKRWQSTRVRGHLAGVAAFLNAKMVGLIIVELLPNAVEIISFFVIPECRYQGIGNQLLKHVEQALIKLKAPQIQVKYRVTELTTSALESILKKQEWQPPQTDFILFKSNRDNILQAPWLNQYSLPDKFTIFPWVELTEADKASIIKRQAYPELLSPFSPDIRLEPLNSLGLRYQGEVVGWVINHRIDSDTVRYSIMFVEERFQKMGRAISLLIESINIQVNSNIFYGTLAVSSSNQPMLKWCDRYLKPYTILTSESRYSYKLLNYRFS
uniref:N-acetyltransferase domain-containing protein n=1 Tax=Tolypothrix bouteillei VB521301 TaxID=1479485 RepID=A0A0C1R732_9CYAN